MAAVAAASASRLASAAAAPGTRRDPQRLLLLPEGCRCARIPRKDDDAKLPMSAAAALASTSTTTSTTSRKDTADDDNSVLFFAYGALMDPAVMQRRLRRRKAGLFPLPRSSSSRAAVAVAFVDGGRKKGEQGNPSSVAVAFVHRGGWATLVDLRKARASAASPLWRLVPGSRREEEEERKQGGGGWSAREREREESDDTENDDTSFISGSCFSSPAHGVLYSLSSESDLEALAEKEGGYSLRRVEVRVLFGDNDEDDDGDDEGGQTLSLEALAFVSSPGLCLRFPLPPRRRYLEKMRTGAREAALDESYRSWLDQVPSTETLDGRYQATPAGAAAAAAGVALFATVVFLLV